MRSTLRGLATSGDAGTRILVSNGSLARVRPWPEEPGVVHLVTVDHHAPPSLSAVYGWLEQLADSGTHTIRTGALGPTARMWYLEAGFTVRQELALLSHDLHGLPPRSAADGLRKMRRNELAELAAVDRRAFGRGWALDVAGLVDALGATPTFRVRVAPGAGGHAAGYAVSGRAGSTAYLQRLAVDPALQRRGVGRGLVVDSLRWARRHRSSNVLVNTHVENDGALALYRGIGFVELDYRLAVLERKLP